MVRFRQIKTDNCRAGKTLCHGNGNPARTGRLAEILENRISVASIKRQSANSFRSHRVSHPRSEGINPFSSFSTRHQNGLRKCISFNKLADIFRILAGQLFFAAPGNRQYGKRKPVESGDLFYETGLAVAHSGHGKEQRRRKIGCISHDIILKLLIGRKQTDSRRNPRTNQERNVYGLAVVAIAWWDAAD